MVCLALPESRIGQAEVLALLLDHLPARFPEIYRRGTDGDREPGHRRALRSRTRGLARGAARARRPAGPGGPLPDAARRSRLPADRRGPVLSLALASRRQARPAARPDPWAGTRLRRAARRDRRSLLRQSEGRAAGLAGQLEPGRHAGAVPAARASPAAEAIDGRARRRAGVAPGRAPDAPAAAAHPRCAVHDPHLHRAARG